jgi:hypothetical protein
MSANPQYNFRLPELIMQQVRVKCAQDGLRLQDAVSQALFAWLHPHLIRSKNPSYVFDPDADYAKRRRNGEEPAAASAGTRRMCEEEGIEDWEPTESIAH